MRPQTRIRKGTISWYLFSMGGVWDAWWQQTYQVKCIILGHVRTLRTMLTMTIYLVNLLPPSVPKSPIGFSFH